MVPNMTAHTKTIKRQKILIFILHCIMKRDGVDRMFLWNFLANNKLQINSRDKPRDASHTTFKNISEKMFSKTS